MVAAAVELVVVGCKVDEVDEELVADAADEAAGVVQLLGEAGCCYYHVAWVEWGEALIRNILISWLSW